MTEHNREQPRKGSFWNSRAGVVLIGFLAIAALLLIYEHRAHIYFGNWLLLALLVACPLMHMFMHGGHGGHGGHGPTGRRDQS